mgnify:CR=1 FL=1
MRCVKPIGALALSALLCGTLGAADFSKKSDAELILPKLRSLRIIKSKSPNV